MHTFTVNEGPALDFELCKHNSPPCEALVQLWQFDKLSILPKGPFIISDRGWAGKIQLITKQNVLTHPLHHKKIQWPPFTWILKNNNPTTDNIINVQLPSTIGTCLAELRGPKTQGRREPTTGPGTNWRFVNTGPRLMKFNIFSGAKNFRSVYHFRVKKFSRTCTLQMLYSDFTSIFHTKIRKFTQKINILPFTQKYLTQISVLPTE
jgi:hypothetical protein